MQKAQRLQTKLDMWSARDLTIFGRAMIFKTLGLSQLVCSALVNSQLRLLHF